MSEHLSNEKFRQEYNKFKRDIVDTFDEPTAAALLTALVKEPEVASKIMNHCRNDLAKKAAIAFDDDYHRYWDATKIADAFKKVDTLIVTLNILARIDSYHWSHLVNLASETSYLDNMVSGEGYLAGVPS